MDHLEHREAIAQRFRARILAGDAFFMRSTEGIEALPYTIHQNRHKELSGMNRFMLLQVMKDRGWRDPRFFTAHQVQEAGWTILPAAAAVTLQYLVATDKHGFAQQTPTIERFKVYCAEQIDRVPPKPAMVRVPRNYLDVAVARAGFEPGRTQLRGAIAAWAGSLQGEANLRDEALTALRIRMALSLLEIQTELPTAPISQEPLAIKWAEALQADPLVLYECVKDAELVAAQVMGQIRVVEAEMHMRETNARATERASVNGGGARNAEYAARLEEMFENRTAVLAVPYAEKDQAQKLGAVWYPPHKVWFVPSGLGLEAFKNWDPRSTSLGSMAIESEIIDAFAREMASHGLETDQVHADGEWHNVRVTTKRSKSNKSGSYVLNLARDGSDTPSGMIVNHHQGLAIPWKWEGPSLTPEQKARLRAMTLEREANAERDRALREEVAAKNASEIWAAGIPATGHGYAEKKRLPDIGLRKVKGEVLLRYDEFHGESGKSAIRPSAWYLLVPMCNMAGELRAVQAISEDGAIKSFMRGAQKKGTMLVLGGSSLDKLLSTPSPPKAVAFVEGLATGTSFRQGSGLPVVVCFDAGGLEFITEQIAPRFPHQTVPVLGLDNDQYFPEQALGFLANHLGVNPHAKTGSVIEILNGPDTCRLVSLGDAIADGEWHQAPFGRYSMTLTREVESTEVKEITVEAVLSESQRRITHHFRNRGLEAGQAAAAAFQREGAGTAQPVLAIPEFRSLEHKPTDWNDLHQAEGLNAVQAAVHRYLSWEGKSAEGRSSMLTQSAPSRSAYDMR